MVQTSGPSQSNPSDSAGINDQVNATRMAFGEHLEELRSCMLRALVGMLICTVVSLLFAKKILAFIMIPAILVLQDHGETPELLALNPAGPFLIYLKVGFLSGAVISAPWILYQLWTFVSSGLYAKERRFAQRFLPVSMGLFVTGVTFMFFIVLPIVMNFFVSFNQGFDLPELQPNWFHRILLGQAEPQPITADMPLGPTVPIVGADPLDSPVGSIWINSTRRSFNVQTRNEVWTVPLKLASRARSVSSQYGLQFFISLVFSLALGFGLAFELPVVVVFLAAMGIVSCATMAKGRRYILFGIVVAAAILTPPDVITQILLAVPMYALFEAGLLVARTFERRRATTSDIEE